MKKPVKIIMIIVAFLLIAGLLFVANGFVGNPISKAIIWGNAKEYVENCYENTDYYVDSVAYSFKTGGYYAHVKSPTSDDTYFSVSYNSFGKIGYDNYSGYVLNRFNTWNRINDDYREITNKIFKNLPYESEIAYGEIVSGDKNSMLDFGLNMADLELDKIYNMQEMGSKYGKIVLYVDTNEVTTKKASEILLEVKNKFDNQNESFYAIDLVLRLKQNEDIKDWQDDNTIMLKCFLYSDINQNNLLEKIETNINQTKKYYDEMDKLIEKVETNINQTEKYYDEIDKLKK